jgi:hypothetical protein
MSITTTPIIRVEAIGPITKHAPDRRCKGWWIPVRFTLEDGSTVDARDPGYSRKMDAAAALAALPREPRNMAAILTDGRYSGFEVRYSC